MNAKKYTMHFVLNMAAFQHSRVMSAIVPKQTICLSIQNSVSKWCHNPTFVVTDTRGGAQELTLGRIMDFALTNNLSMRLPPQQAEWL